MKSISDRRRKREAVARPVRDQLKLDVRGCEVCGKKRDPELLAGHEISNGPLRQKSLDLRFALLVVCRYPDWKLQRDCHRIVQNEPEARQLARLWLSRPHDYDLAAYLLHTRPAAPNRIEQWEVDAEIQSLLDSHQHVRSES